MTESIPNDVVLLDYPSRAGIDLKVVSFDSSIDSWRIRRRKSCCAEPSDLAAARIASSRIRIRTRERRALIKIVGII